MSGTLLSSVCNTTTFLDPMTRRMSLDMSLRRCLVGVGPSYRRVAPNWDSLSVMFCVYCAESRNALRRRNAYSSVTSSYMQACTSF